MLEVLNKSLLEKIIKEFSICIEDSVTLVSSKDANFNSSEKYNVIWRIETGLYDDELNKWILEDLVIYIAFKNDFPNSIPKIYFDKSDFKKIGHIPHVSYKNTDVCAFDDFVILDVSRPLDIILEIYNKAKKVLIEGITKKNYSDFLEEYKAYWDNLSSENDRIDAQFYYCVIENENSDENSFKILTYKKSNNKATENILFSNEEILIDPFIEYLKTNKIDFKVADTFYIGQDHILNHPPFDISNFYSLNLIPKDKKIAFKNYFNKNKDNFNYVIFYKKIENKSMFFGWRYEKPNLNLNGFRKEKLSHFDTTFSSFLPHNKKNVLRFSFESLIESRIFNRTSSEKLKSIKYKFLIAGLGSVGSNLVYYLNNINFPDFTLIDSDYLGIENIGRHLLGFDNINYSKVEIINKFIKNKYPSQNVTTFEDSFSNIYNNNKKIFENQDYIFLCTGKLNIEKWMISKILSNEFEKPIFMIWVEPYLLGGQCLYIHPNKKVNLDELFLDIYKFKYSVIQQKEFEIKRDLFVLKESGCQSNFSPYSSTHLSLFLSSIFVDIFSIIEEKKDNSIAITWIGDKSIAEELEIQINYQEYDKYSKIINTL